MERLSHIVMVGVVKERKVGVVWRIAKDGRYRLILIGTNLIPLLNCLPKEVGLQLESRPIRLRLL